MSIWVHMGNREQFKKLTLTGKISKYMYITMHSFTSEKVLHDENHFAYAYRKVQMIRMHSKKQLIPLLFTS